MHLFRPFKAFLGEDRKSLADFNPLIPQLVDTKQVVWELALRELYETTTISPLENIQKNIMTMIQIHEERQKFELS